MLKSNRIFLIHSTLLTHSVSAINSAPVVLFAGSVCSLLLVAMGTPCMRIVYPVVLLLLSGSPIKSLSTYISNNGLDLSALQHLCFVSCRYLSIRFKLFQCVSPGSF